jgi:hypothetical protein
MGAPADLDAIAAERVARRRVRLMVDMTAACIYQDDRMVLGEAVRMIQTLRSAILSLFPDGGSTFDLVVRPRFERILTERWGVAFETLEVGSETGAARGAGEAPDPARD